MNYKINNAKLLMYSDNKFYIDDKTLYIKDNKIYHIGDMDINEENNNEENNFEEIDAKNKLVMPGLINMHGHTYMSLFRNYADDLPFNEWLFEKIMPVEDSLDKQDAYYPNMLSCMEMIKTGTTTYLDMHMYSPYSGKAAHDSKMRAYLSRSVVGDDLYSDPRRFNEMLDEKEKYESDLVKFMMMPHAIYTASPNLIKEANEEANELGILKQIHLSETNTEVNDSYEKYNKSPVELLDEIGFLDERTSLAHCVKLKDNDFKILKDRKVTVVTNVASNCKLGNGFAPIKRMLDEGINVTIGTDGVSSNNTLNMFREMGLLSLIHKGVNEDVLVLGANDVLKMATVNAAHALGRDDELGIIKEGALADLIFIDLKAPNMFPNNNIVSSLVYSANGSEVESVMINGEFVMRDNKILTFNEDEIYDGVNNVVNKYLVK